MSLHFNEKKHPSAKGLLTKLRSVFSQIPEPQRDTRGIKTKIPLVDCLMSGLAIFGLKFPSLLQFDQGLNDDAVRHNLKTLYGIDKAPSDTYIRTRLDEVDPQLLRPAFTSLFSVIQRGKVVDDYRFLNEYVLAACDGTGLFSSEQVHCINCCEKHHKDGRVTYYHQMLAGVLIHPVLKRFFPSVLSPFLNLMVSQKMIANKMLLRDF